MILLVDMGNSTMKWATVSAGILSPVNVLPYTDSDQSLKPDWESLSAPDKIVVSCVADEQQWLKLVDLVQARWGIIPQRLVSPGTGNGVVNAYPQPEKLGSDRWAAIVAAHTLFDADVCVVDCGTALTIDLLLASGQHLGGAIVPGARMMQNSLHTNTSALPSAPLIQPERFNGQYWGQDTQSGIINGSWLALSGVVEKVYSQFKKQSDNAICVLSGGDAMLLSGYLGIKAELEPDLVLKGMAVIAGDNITI